MTTKLDVQIWSDIACPWCYVGKRRLEAAVARLPAGAQVEVVWRAFELDPTALRVRDTSQSNAERLAKKYGMSKAQAEQSMQRLTDLAAADGLAFRFDTMRPGNTFDAHRVLHLARERGKQDAVKERFLRGYMTEGEAIGDPEVLVRLAAEAGMDRDEVRALLASDTYARDVRADEAAASALGIHGVPFFVIGGRYGVSGAQSAEALLSVLTRAMEDAPKPELGEGAACGPDGCA